MPPKARPAQRNPESIVGIDANNNLNGTKARDCMNGLAGDDTIIGDSGNDLITDATATTGFLEGLEMILLTVEVVMIG